MRKNLIVALNLLLLLGLNISLFAQPTPVVGVVPGLSTKNVISGGLTDQDGLTITNTGTVPLRFCMNNSAIASCVGLPAGILADPGKTINVTVPQLGGVSAGAYLNVSNQSLEAGSYVVVKAAPVPNNCLSADPTAWQNIFVQPSGNKLFLCPIYTNVGIGIFNPIATLDVAGTQRLSGDFTHVGDYNLAGSLLHTGNVNHQGNATITGTTDHSGNFNIHDGTLKLSALANPTKIVLNSTGSNKKSQISFQQNNSELWTIGTDHIPDNTSSFFIYNSSTGIPFFISPTGKVGIGTTTPSNDYALSVNGHVRAKKVVIETSWSDFVFEKDYKLMSLAELEQFILEHKHLPHIPPAIEASDADH
jgi:hypothetical protein